MMKYFYSGVTLCMIALLVLFSIDILTRIDKLEKETEFKVQQQNYKIDQLEKEIRILKSDIGILTNDFLSGGEDER